MTDRSCHEGVESQGVWHRVQKKGENEYYLHWMMSGWTAERRDRRCSGLALGLKVPVRKNFEINSFVLVGQTENDAGPFGGDLQSSQFLMVLEYEEAENMGHLTD